MKIFNLKVHGKDKIFQIATENNSMATIACILDQTENVTMWALDGEKEKVTGFLKYSSGLAMRHLEAKTDAAITQSIIDAITRINDERIEKYAGCYVDSFVGGPGDYSPPPCYCPKCIAAGRAYKFNSINLRPSRDMYAYFKDVLQGLKESKLRRWGIDHTIPGVCNIELHQSQHLMHINTNKQQIRIGSYYFDHATKEFTPVRGV